MKKYKSPQAVALEIEESKIAAETSSLEIPDGNIESEDDNKFFPGAW